MLGIYVKMAYFRGFQYSRDSTIAQFTLGFTGLLILNLLRKQKTSTVH